ncbi:MAG: vanadium-dependent haloperoxidase [Caldilineaceae bacterium]
MNTKGFGRRLWAWLLFASLIAAFSPAASTTWAAAPNPGQIEPGAGKWQTWVLKSGSELRPAAPPDQAATRKELAELQTLVAQRNAKALDQIAYWDAGAPNYRWLEIAFAAEGDLNPPRALRLNALLNVAIYDAMIAAWDAKYAYNRLRPSDVDPKLTTVIATPHSPAYPSEQAVAAGAAAAILTYLFPDNAQVFAAKAEEAGRSRLFAGVNYPSDVQAGLALGRAVAAKVIARAKADGSDVKWTGSVPTEKGKWNGTKPVEPLMGTWKTWVLTSGNQFRPPAPPAYDSAALQTELKEIETFTHTWDIDQKALYWQTDEGAVGFWYNTASLRIFEHHLDSNPPQAARIYALMSVAHYDALVACYDAKYTYWAMRPFMVDQNVVTLFKTPNHPSYPSAHGCISGAIADVIGGLFPAEAQAIHDKADEAAMSRLWAGIHFRSDIAAGLKVGRSVAQVVLAHAKQDGARATQ